jgi:integrase
LRYLSGEAEAERLLQASEESLRPIVVTALHAGMRKGELLGLTWDLVDMIHGFIRLKQTKNGKARALPFNETLWSLFSGLRTRQDLPWVFHDAAGHRWSDIGHPFEAACEGAGLTDFYFHASAYLRLLAHDARRPVSHCQQPPVAYDAQDDPPLCPPFA